MRLYSLLQLLCHHHPQLVITVNCEFSLIKTHTRVEQLLHVWLHYTIKFNHWIYLKQYTKFCLTCNTSTVSKVIAIRTQSTSVITSRICSQMLQMSYLWKWCQNQRPPRPPFLPLLSVNILLFIFIIILLYSVQHWRSDSNMCCSLWIILT